MPSHRATNPDLVTTPPDASKQAKPRDHLPM
jgi:hypothetical protein